MQSRVVRNEAEVFLIISTNKADNESARVIEILDTVTLEEQRAERYRHVWKW